MSDNNEADNNSAPDVDVDENYKPPAQKTIEEILQADKEDDSLRRYKEALLGAATKGEAIIVGNKDKKVQRKWKMNW